MRLEMRLEMSLEMRLEMRHRRRTQLSSAGGPPIGRSRGCQLPLLCSSRALCYLAVGCLFTSSATRGTMRAICQQEHPYRLPHRLPPQIHPHTVT